MKNRTASMHKVQIMTLQQHLLWLTVSSHVEEEIFGSIEVVYSRHFLMNYPCVVCKIHGRPRQHALECDGCFQWQHRLCSSGNFNFILKL